LPESFNRSPATFELPRALQSLHVGDEFDQPIPHEWLPATLKKLEFGRRFNHQLKPGVLPLELKILIFGTNFNQPILPGVLPDGLIELDLFDSAFNCTFLPRSLPSSIRCLELPPCFDKLIARDILPSALESFEFPAEFTHPINNGVFSEGIHSIFLNEFTFEQLSADFQFPCSLRCFVVSGCLYRLSPVRLGLFGEQSRLEELRFEDSSSAEEQKEIQFRIEPGALPPSIRRLRLDILNQPTSGLLDSLAHLDTLALNHCAQPISSHSLPCSLFVLEFGPLFNQSLLTGSLSNTRIRSLALDEKWQSEIEIGSFPATLKRLSIKRLKQPIVRNLFPEGLERLTIGAFEHSIEPNSFPLSLAFLHLSWRCDAPLTADFRQSNIKFLHLHFTSFSTVNTETIQFPLCLIELTLEYLMQPIELALIPPTVEKLTLNVFAVQSGIPPLLSSVSELHFGPFFSQPLIARSLSGTRLQSLQLPHSWSSWIEMNSLPDTLKQISFLLPFFLIEIQPPERSCKRIAIPNADSSAASHYQCKVSQFNSVAYRLFHSFAAIQVRNEKPPKPLFVGSLIRLLTECFSTPIPLSYFDRRLPHRIIEVCSYNPRIVLIAEETEEISRLPWPASPASPRHYIVHSDLISEYSFQFQSRLAVLEENSPRESGFQQSNSSDRIECNLLDWNSPHKSRRLDANDAE
jgi:hypothetical protein